MKSFKFFKSSVLSNISLNMRCNPSVISSNLSFIVSFPLYLSIIKQMTATKIAESTISVASTMPKPHPTDP